MASDPYSIPSVLEGFEFAPLPNQKSETGAKSLSIPASITKGATPEAQTAMNEIMTRREHTARKFDYTHVQQDTATKLFASLNLHIPSIEPRDIQTKFVLRSSSNSDRKGRANPAENIPANQRQLADYGIGGANNKKHASAPATAKAWFRKDSYYACSCGTKTGARSEKPDPQRQIAWQDLGCPAWVRVVTMHQKEDPKIFAFLEISGILAHSGACDAALVMDSEPRIPIHPDVRNYALSLLREHAPISYVRSKCREYSQSRWPNELGDDHYRYFLASYDSSSLYRTIAREVGIPQKSKPEENLDRWFGSQAAPPSPELTTSCLHYQPETEQDRFEIVLSTPQMQQVAWKFAHNRQIFMDLTFGFCSARCLLAIILAVNQNRKGVPIAFIIFTARKSAKAVHADYNADLLTRLLGKFKFGLGPNELGEFLTFCVGTIDMDPREDTALTYHNPAIFILLCIFHVWQAWRNGLDRFLRQIPKGDARKSVRLRLATFLMRLMREVLEYDEARQLYNDEIKHFAELSRSRDPIVKKQAAGAQSFLAYFTRYIKTRDAWLPWSPAAVLKAAELLGISPEEVFRTNNILESFNGRIKGKYFLPHIHSGRLPRIDIWILLLITQVMPDFFAELDSLAKAADWRASKRTVSSHDKAGQPQSAIVCGSSPAQLQSAAIDKWIEEEHELEHEEEEEEPVAADLLAVPTPFMDLLEGDTSGEVSDVPVDSSGTRDILSQDALPDACDDAMAVDVDDLLSLDLGLQSFIPASTSLERSFLLDASSIVPDSEPGSLNDVDINIDNAPWMSTPAQADAHVKPFLESSINPRSVIPNPSQSLEHSFLIDANSIVPDSEPGSLNDVEINMNNAPWMSTPAQASDARVSSVIPDSLQSPAKRRRLSSFAALPVSSPPSSHPSSPPSSGHLSLSHSGFFNTLNLRSPSQPASSSLSTSLLDSPLLPDISPINSSNSSHSTSISQIETNIQRIEDDLCIELGKLLVLAPERYAEVANQYGERIQTRLQLNGDSYRDDSERVVDHVSSLDAPHKLLPFPKQVKEKRHEAYGI